MKVLVLEPYYTGSHKYWADNLVKFSGHDITLMTMKGKYWKWRLQGAAIYFSEQVKHINSKPDLILCSSLMDVSVFKSLSSEFLKGNSSPIPVHLFMHENQLTYPYSDQDTRRDENFNYGFINFKSCLAADRVIFNSFYHKQNFLSALRALLKRLPDYSIENTIETIETKSSVIYVGIDIERIVSVETDHKDSTPTLLWNNRWDNDKNPKMFLDLCNYLETQDVDYSLILTGTKGNQSEETFQHLISKFKHRVKHAGYLEDYTQYIKMLKQATILPVTSDHDFYGISVMEAILCGVYPILPSGKVYEEFLDVEEYPELYYKKQEDLFDKVLEMLKTTKPNIIQDTLFEQGIHKVLERFDLHITKYGNVKYDHTS